MKVSWDDDIPNSMEKYNMFQTTNQNKPWFSSIPLLAPDLVVSIDIDHLEIPMQKWWQEFPIHTPTEVCGHLHDWSQNQKALPVIAFWCF